MKGSTRSTHGFWHIGKQFNYAAGVHPLLKTTPPTITNHPFAAESAR
jgi:hypothetical protein